MGAFTRLKGRTREFVLSIVRLSGHQASISTARVYIRGSKGSELELKKCLRTYETLVGSKPRSFCEIGANLGQDAMYVARSLKLASENVAVFEPHPELFPRLASMDFATLYPLVVGDRDLETVPFRSIQVGKGNDGISSVRKHPVNPSTHYEITLVKQVRIDTLIQQGVMFTPEFVKIDVEGNTMEVLLGFGNYLEQVKCLHLETERKQIWEDQFVWSEVREFLEFRNFALVEYELQEDGIQADSFWIRSDLLRSRIQETGSNTWRQI